MPWLNRVLKRMFSIPLSEQSGRRRRFQAKSFVGYCVNSQVKYRHIMTNKKTGVLCARLLFAGSQSPPHVLHTIFGFLAPKFFWQEEVVHGA
jgi:hypothetical protein